MFKNCNLLESFSKISSDYDKESFNDMENTIVQNKNIDNKNHLQILNQMIIWKIQIIWKKL